MFGATLKFLLRYFLNATLYPTPDSLAAAGFEDPTSIAGAARACPKRKKLALECAGPALALLQRDGLLSNSGAPLREAGS